MANTIPISKANSMIQQNINYMTGLGVDMHNQTQSVGFSGAELMKWLGDVMPFADELRVCIGVYPVPDPQAGRITAILWPYKNGQPATKPIIAGKDDPDGQGIDPFNEGEGKP